MTEEDPWNLLQLLLRRYPVDRVQGLPPFLGGAAGYFSYDLGRTLERLPATAADEGLPELDVGFYDWVLAAGHLSGESWVLPRGCRRARSPTRALGSPGSRSDYTLFAPRRAALQS